RRKTMRQSISIFSALVCLVLMLPANLFAHGVIGKRFVPESMTVTDPFPSDEADLLAFSHQKTADALVNSYGFGISKRLSPNFSVDLDGAYDRIRPNDDAARIGGFENIGLSVKYAALRLPEHELLVTTALGWEIGGTGSREIGREAHSAVTPQLLFVYGLGDLPDGVRYL